MTNPLRNLRVGDPIPTSVRTWNPILETARARVSTSIPSALPKTQQPPPLRIKNTTGGALERGSPIFVDPADDPVLTPDNAAGSFESTIILTGSEFPADGIQPMTAFVILEPVGEDKIVRAVCTGLVATKINVDHELHEFVQYKEEANQFESAAAGWPIVWKESGTGEKWAYVRLGDFQSPKLIGKTDGAIAVDGSGTVSIWRNGADTTVNVADVNLDWIHGDEDVSSGAEVIIEYFRDEGLWRIVGASCE